ncbi:MAG: hypothetical protein IJU63_07995 [Bacteroidales bacterium]|nr:hypothetical protein [Bacteroidales bacterium]
MTAVIADDITGAAEVAGVCLRKGISVRLLIGVPAPEALGGAEVLVLATNTRAGSREEACAAMQEIALQLCRAGITQIFKKTDSALRGWVLAEMGTLAHAFGRRSLLIQPANPDTGRSVRNGIYYVKGLPLAQTPFRDDPEFPATTSDAAELLRLRGAGLDIPFRIPDAQGPEDLRESAAQCRPEELPGGSAAFWQACLESCGPHAAAAGATEAGGLDLSGSLVICGSAHPASHAWCRELAAAGFPVREMPEALCRIGQDGSAPAREWTRECIEAWHENGRLLVRSAEKQLPLPDDPGRPGRRLAECAARLLAATRPAGVLVEGGATAWEILQRLGWNAFTPLREWSPGVVSLRLDAAPHCTVTLKPGSYAWPHIKRL